MKCSSIYNCKEWEHDANIPSVNSSYPEVINAAIVSRGADQNKKGMRMETAVTFHYSYVNLMAARNLVTIINTLINLT